LTTLATLPFSRDTLPECGVEPGLRFAVLLDGRGGGEPLRWDAVAQWRPDDGVLWIHLERDHPRAQAWMREESGIEPVIAEAVIAEESRPRVETLDDTLMIVLRGLSRIAGPDQAEAELGAGLDFVPVHLLIEPSRVISLRDQNHQMSALRDVRDALAHGRGPLGPAGILVAIADKVIKDLEPYLDLLDDEVDLLEERVLGGDPGNVRSALATLRRRAIHLRRYLAPQRDAMSRLQHEDPSWLDGRSRVHLREVFDKVLRYIEYLDAIRDRATILHEDLSALISERIARTSNRLAAVASLLLPPSLLAGLLGMNVGGIPGSDNPWAFPLTAAGIILFTAVILLVMRYKRWL